MNGTCAPDEQAAQLIVRNVDLRFGQDLGTRVLAQELHQEIEVDGGIQNARA
jgi:hypothetical protein